MPRVTISISNDDNLLTLDLPPGLTVQDLKGFVQAETNHPADAQQFFFNGQALNNPSQSLEAAGVKDGDMLAVHIRQRTAPAAATSSQQRAQQVASPRPSQPGFPDPEQVRQHVLSNPGAQQDLASKRPELYAVLRDPQRWRESFNSMRQQEEDAARERQEQMARLNEDPFNIEAQRKIEEIIRQERVIENLQDAYEKTPEVFARVHMLYINTEVNGVPVKAFVDSGAQATIMSPDCAERCHIMRLLDTRYSGMARGVGTARILGRVHSAEIKIGGAVMSCAFTVMEGKDVDLLFGLDMLKRYKAKIDLDKNVLSFEGIEVPFLPESEIPKTFEEQEPTVPGPGGTQVGGVSGKVIQPDRSGGPARVAVGPPSASASSSRPAPAAPSAPPPASHEPPQKDVDTLVSLGFSRHDAIQALQATGGNVEFAASLLFSK